MKIIKNKSIKLILIILFTIIFSCASMGSKDSDIYPVTGLRPRELRCVIKTASTNLPDGAAVNYVDVRKSSVTVRTIITREGATIPGDDLILKAEGNEWKLSGKTESQKMMSKVGLPVSELISLLSALPPRAKVLSIYVESNQKVRVEFGEIFGPVAGFRDVFVFEEIDGKWTNIYPVTGLRPRELRHVIEAASTNLPDDAAVNYIGVHKSSITVRTIITREGATIPGDDLILKAEGNEWKLSGKAESKEKMVKAGLPVSELISLVSALPSRAKVLSIRVESNRKVNVSTGYVGGPLTGELTIFAFEKIDGKWKKTGKEWLIL